MLLSTFLITTLACSVPVLSAPALLPPSSSSSPSSADTTDPSSSSHDVAPAHSKPRQGYTVANVIPLKDLTATQWSNLRRERRHIGAFGASSNHDSPLPAPHLESSNLRARTEPKTRSASRRLRRNHSLRSSTYHAPRSAAVAAALKPISLPLRPVRGSVGKREERVHGLVYLQQHMNRAHRRHAEMVGRAVDRNLLKKRMEERLVSLGPEGEKLRKRDLLGGLLGGVAESLGVGTDGRKAASTKDEPESSRQTAVDPVGATNVTKPVVTSAADGFSDLEFDAAVTGKVTQASAVTASQSVGLAIEANDVGYFAPILLGTPAKTFQILMDSGSADFWVPSQICDSCGNHEVLGSRTSSSFVASRESFQVTYGTGEVQGAIVSDVLDIAGLRLENLTFGVTTDESEEFSGEGVPFDGLMGLAQSKLSNMGVLTPIEAMKKEGLVAAAQVSYKLGRVADGVNDGQITFGGIDSTKFVGNLTLFDNVNKQGFWEGAVGATAVDGKDAGLRRKTAILDTGTTLIIMPKSDADAVHALIPGASSDGQGGYIIPCTTTSVVSFTFGGTSFDIDPRDLAFQPLTNDLKGDCASGISAGDIGGANQWLVGDVFLKSTVFTTIVDTNQMGLAVAKSVTGA